MLSIITPTLNEEKYLPLLLDSIKKQEFKDYEIIVADAGSKDKTVEIAQKAGCRIVKGGKAPFGRNRGAEAARGDILFFLDADLVPCTSKFLGNAIKEFHDRKLSAAGFAIRALGGKKIDEIAFLCWNTIAFVCQKFSPYVAGAIMVTKEAHNSVGGFDEQGLFADDVSYARAVGKKFKFGFIKNEPIFFSTRRFEKDGRFKTYIKNILAGFYLLFLGTIKSDIFKYKYGHYQEKTKK